MRLSALCRSPEKPDDNLIEFLWFADGTIRNGLFQSKNRVRIDKLDTAGPTPVFLPATTRQDDINEFSGGLYFENKIQWGPKLRSVGGVRGDIYNFDVTDYDPLNPGVVGPANSGNHTAAVASPKGSLIFGPWAQTELYASGGFGFHSDDVRGTTARVNPDGASATPLCGLFQTKGAEIGARTEIVPHLQSTLSLWYLYRESELLFEGDTGTTVNSKQPSHRYGIELANYWSPTKRLTFLRPVHSSLLLLE